MKASSHMPNQGIEYQGTDACYLNLPPDVRQTIGTSIGILYRTSSSLNRPTELNQVSSLTSTVM